MRLNEIINRDVRIRQAQRAGFDISEIWYHGSPSEDIEGEGITQQRTSYGYFVTHDPDTARGYSTDGTGQGFVYSVVLKVKNVLDMTDGIPLDVAKETLFPSEPQFNTDEAHKFIEYYYEQGIPVVKQWVDSMAEGVEGETIEEILDYESGDDIHEWIMKTGNSRLLAAFTGKVGTIWEEYEWLQDSYGTNGFYLDYQRDVLHAVESLGYDAVDMYDESSTGEPYSRVIFKPGNMMVIDRTNWKDDIDDEFNSRF